MNFGCESILDGKKINEFNPLVLAFLGDAIHTAFVRERVVLCHTYSAGAMHKECAKYCSAVHQSIVLDELLPMLSEEEKEVVLRARNAKNSHYAKNSTLADYKKATSFEALVGFLYLVGNNVRLNQILELSIK